MSDNSKIEWTDATWNVVIGCDKVSPGCDHCYAIRTAHRMQANPNPAIAEVYAGTEADGEWTGKVNLIEKRLGLPLSWSRPRRIFVNAQSDLFHADVPNEFIARVWAVMATAGQHTFQILTKRPGRMRSLLSNEVFECEVDAFARELGFEGYFGLPLPNVWLGVSVEDQKRADLRIPQLLATPAAVRFLSCEPLLGPVDLVQSINQEPLAAYHFEPGGIDWVIVGGESGPGARPMHPDWVRQLRETCTRSEVAFHFKQWGEWAPVGTAENPSEGNGRRLKYERRCLTPDGGEAGPWQHGRFVERVGKKAAGRELDGRTWDEFPQAVIA